MSLQRLSRWQWQFFTGIWFVPGLGFGDMCKPSGNTRAILPVSAIVLILVLVMRGAEFPGIDFPYTNFCMHMLLVPKDCIFASPERIWNSDFSIGAAWVKWNSLILHILAFSQSMALWIQKLEEWIYFSKLKNMWEEISVVLKLLVLEM